MNKLIEISFPGSALRILVGPLSLEEARQKQKELIEKIEPGKANVTVGGFDTVEEAFEKLNAVGALKK